MCEAPIQQLAPTGAVVPAVPPPEPEEAPKATPKPSGVELFLSEKTLRTELEQASTQLKDIRVFSDGADAQACQGQGERERERERARARAWGAPRRERGGAPKRSH